MTTLYYAVNAPTCVANEASERAAAEAAKASERAARRKQRAARLVAAIAGAKPGEPVATAEPDTDSDEEGTAAGDAASAAPTAAPAAEAPQGPRARLASVATAAYLKAHAASDAVGLTDALEQAARAARYANEAALQATGLALGACGLRRPPAGVSDDEAEAAAAPGGGAATEGPSARTQAEECKDQGNAAFKRGRFDAALRSYTRAAELDCSCATYQTNRAAALMALSRNNEAAEACVAALALDGGSERARTRLATLCVGGGALEAALAAASSQPQLSALAKQLRCVAAARLEGRTYFDNAEFARAEAAYGRGLEAAKEAGARGAPPAPGAALLLCNRAAARAALGRHAEALDDADAALALVPSYDKAAARRAAEVRLLADAARVTATSERDGVAAELRAAGVAVPDVAAGAALGDDAWGRAPCAACVPLGRDARACRAAFRHRAPDVECATWRTGGRVRFARRAAAVGRGASLGAALAPLPGAAAAAEGDELTVEGTIVGFDWPSGLHAVACDRGRGTLHVRLRTCAELVYTSPSAPQLPPEK